MNSLALITVVFENYTILDDLFKSLSKQTDSHFHVFVVDVSKNKKPYSFPSFVTYLPAENKGYAHAINLGIRSSIANKHTTFVALNSDVVLESRFVAQTKKALTLHPRSIIGGKIYYAPGYEYHKNRYTTKDEGHVFWYAGGFINWDHVTIHHRGVDEVDKGQYEKFETTSFITGCCMTFDIAVIQTLRFWSESYFMYYEDADYCARAHLLKIPLYYNPHIVLWHKSGQSTQGAASLFQQHYLNKNRLRFGLLYAPFRTKLHLLKNTLLNKK